MYSIWSFRFYFFCICDGEAENTAEQRAKAEAEAHKRLEELFEEYLKRSKVTDLKMYQGIDGLDLKYTNELLDNVRTAASDAGTLTKDERDRLILLMLELTKWTIINTSYGMKFSEGLMSYSNDSHGTAREILWHLYRLNDEFLLGFDGINVLYILQAHGDFLSSLEQNEKPFSYKGRNLKGDIATLDALIQKYKIK